MDHKFRIIGGNEFRKMGIKFTNNGQGVTSMHLLRKVPLSIFLAYYEGALDIELPEHYVIVPDISI